MAGGVSVRRGLGGLLRPVRESVRPSCDMRGVASAEPCEPRAPLGRGGLFTKPRAGGGPAAGNSVARGRPAQGRPPSRNGLASLGGHGAVTSGPTHRGE